MEREPDPTGTHDLQRAFERRGEQLVAQRLGFSDALADALSENDDLRADVDRLRSHLDQTRAHVDALETALAGAQQSVRELDDALGAAHRQIEEEHARLSFRVADKTRRLYARAMKR